MKSVGLVSFLLMSVLQLARAGQKCVWVTGRVECKKDPSQQLNAEVRIYDRDGKGFLQAFDADDMMGVSYAQEDGRFQVEGCASDRDWLPFIDNDPEPFMQIRHFCNDPVNGETLRFPEFNTFVPTTKEYGLIELDSDFSK